MYWSVYRPPVEAYEVDDTPQRPRIDPVAKVFRLVALFCVLQALNLIGIIFIAVR